MAHKLVKTVTKFNTLNATICFNDVIFGLILDTHNCILFKNTICFKYPICYQGSAESSIKNPRAHWSKTSDARPQSTRRDRENAEKTYRIWESYSILPDFNSTVIIMATITNEPLEWFTHNTSLKTFYIWLISIQSISTDWTTQPPSSLPHLPTLPSLPSLPPSLPHPPTVFSPPISLPPCHLIGQFYLMNKCLAV